jgi:hypothetical protein
MTAKQKAGCMFSSNYMLLMEYGEEMSQEVLISVLSIKFAVKQCEDTVLLLEHYRDEFNIEYYQEVKQCLLEM